MQHQDNNPFMNNEPKPKFNTLKWTHRVIFQSKEDLSVYTPQIRIIPRIIQNWLYANVISTDIRIIETQREPDNLPDLMVHKFSQPQKYALTQLLWQFHWTLNPWWKGPRRKKIKATPHRKEIKRFRLLPAAMQYADEHYPLLGMSIMNHICKFLYMPGKLIYRSLHMPIIPTLIALWIFQQCLSR